MAALGEYQLFWSDSDATAKSSSNLAGSLGARDDQYVFTTRVDAPMRSRLRRVKTVYDLLEVIAGKSRSIDGYAVAGLALLIGNLIATGRWMLLLTFALGGALLAVLELRLAAAAGAAVLVELLASSVWDGLVSVEWLVTVAAVVLSALATMTIAAYNVREDPREHVLVSVRPGADVVLRNDTCMDVKLLVFDGADFVRLVPKGGLFSGVLLPRGGTHCIAGGATHVIKAYAPWGRELGTYHVWGGGYSFRATAPPLLVSPSGAPSFRNCSQEPVIICQCSPQCWTSSLWLPAAPVWARLVWPAVSVAPGQSVPISGPCQLRVYEPSRGAVAERACCALRKGEGAEYVGPMEWSTVRTGVRKSVSSMLVAMQ